MISHSASETFYSSGQIVNKRTFFLKPVYVIDISFETNYSTRM